VSDRLTIGAAFDASVRAAASACRRGRGQQNTATVLNSWIANGEDI
jgi:hypothetical protein